MHKPFLLAASTAMVLHGAAMANTYMVEDLSARSGAHVRSAGIGVQLGLTVQLGKGKSERSSDRVRFDFTAGPAQTMQSMATFEQVTAVAPLARFSIKPGYGSDLSFANHRLASHRTILGAAEDKNGDDDNDGPSTLGWVAIGVGALVGVGLLVEAVCSAGPGTASSKCLGSR